jgi:hypothetical protein
VAANLGEFAAIPAMPLIQRFSGVPRFFGEDEMTKPKPKATAIPHPEGCFTVEQTPDEVRGILWKIASDPEQSGTARVAACALLLRDHRERGDGGEARQDADLNRRALALMRRVAAN